MLNDADNGYAYAKACGIIGKSFLGKRISSLSGLRALNDFERLVFSDNQNDIYEKDLLASLETKITERAVRRISGVVSSYSRPPKLLLYMLKSFEYGNLKECLSAASLGKKDTPAVCDIGRFGSIRYNAYPDIRAMLKNTEYKSLTADWDSNIDMALLEVKLDYHFYKNLIESLSELSGDDREAAQRLLCDEISLRNCLWALRLRSYYEKNETQTESYLMDFLIPGENQKKRLVSAAKVSLNFHLDVRQHWDGWKWEKFLNNEPPQTRSDSQQNFQHWAADPRHFQNAASRYLYLLALRGFHSAPMSVSAVYCFIKLIQFEEDLLSSVAQGLALGMDSAGVLKMLGEF